MRDKELCTTLESIFKILRSIRLCFPLAEDHAGLIDHEMIKLLEVIKGMGGGVD